MLVCVCCDLTQASNFRLRLHGTGRIIFNRLKNLTGYFVHTGLFDIFALFTWKYEQLSVYILIRVNGTLNRTKFNRWKFVRFPVNVALIERFFHDLETKTREQRNRNKTRTEIWLVYRTDTNARGFWLVRQTLGWKNFLPKNFLEIIRYFALTSYCKAIGLSNNAFSILRFSLAGDWRVHVLIFSSNGS